MATQRLLREIQNNSLLARILGRRDRLTRAFRLMKYVFSISMERGGKEENPLILMELEKT